MEKIADGITVTLPQILVEGELDRMIAKFKNDIERMGMKFEEYIASTKKSLEEIRKEWETDAQKRVKIQIALNEIAANEKLKVSPEDLESRVEDFLEQIKDADPARVRIHIENMLMNEEVFKFLEGQK